MGAHHTRNENIGVIMEMIIYNFILISVGIATGMLLRQPRIQKLKRQKRALQSVEIMEIEAKGEGRKINMEIILKRMNEIIGDRDLPPHERIEKMNPLRERLGELGYKLIDVNPTDKNGFSYFDVIEL